LEIPLGLVSLFSPAKVSAKETSLATEFQSSRILRSSERAPFDMANPGFRQASTLPLAVGELLGLLFSHSSLAFP
jgi:hypothetical protein